MSYRHYALSPMDSLENVMHLILVESYCAEEVANT